MRRQIMLQITAVLMLSALLTGCTATADQRTGEAQGYGGVLRVTVKMNGTDVTEVKVTEHSETQGVGTRAIDALPAAIANADSADVDAVSGATITSEAIKSAVRQAMGQSGEMGSTVPMDSGAAATQAPSMMDGVRAGLGMAATGRLGPGEANSLNIVFAAAMFDEEGRILHVDVDQLEIFSPEMTEGNVFPGFPAEDGKQEDFLAQIKTWVTKGAMGADYALTSGTWREEMDVYQRQMVGKTMDEVNAWFSGSFDQETGRPNGDAVAGATISLRGEYGDILTAIQRAWEDAQRGAGAAADAQDGTMTDTAEPTDAVTEGTDVG